MNECTRCGIEIEAGVFNQIRHDEECKGTKEFPVRHLSEMGIPMTSTPRTIIQLQEAMSDYCTELGCKEGKHHPECAMNPIEKKNNNWDSYDAYTTKESARQRFMDAVSNKQNNIWLVLIGIQIIVAAILKYRGIL